MKLQYPRSLYYYLREKIEIIRRIDNSMFVTWKDFLWSYEEADLAMSDLRSEGYKTEHMQDGFIVSWKI
jgi:hypothetical protein